MMTRLLAAYGATLLVLVVIDLVWLGVIARPLYVQGIGHLMAEKPRIVPAAIFYAVYAAGLMVFAVWPQAGTPGWMRTAGLAALFGFFAYATYDLTNLSTLKGWPLGLALMDMAWGTAVSAAAAGAGKWVLDRMP